MKIHKIRFKNINNLKGEHEVLFNQLPLSAAGIFAIVGPTGSGKSTILDVITLSLFNKIPRFKKAVSKNEIINEGSVLTHHTSDAYAQIEYEIKGLNYSSEWSVAKNRNGKLKDYEMTFYNPDGSIADLKRSEVPAKNEAIIGLKYDQFVKSILLSQGQFSKFLKAGKNERGQLLENITGTSIYREIGIEVFEKYKQSKAELDLEKGLIGAITTMEKPERDALKNELNSLQKLVEQLEPKLVKSVQLSQIKKDVVELKKQLLEKNNLSALISEEVSSFKSDKKRLEIHHKLSSVQGPLATYSNAVKNADQSEQNLKEYKVQLESAKVQHADSIEEMSSLTKVKVDNQSFKKVMNDFETEINNADKDLENLIKTGKEKRERINKLKADYVISFADDVNPQKAKALLVSRATELKKLLVEVNIKADKPISKIKEKHKNQTQKLKLLIELDASYKEAALHSNKNSKLEKELSEQAEKKKRLVPTRTKSVQLIESFKNNIDLLLKQKEAMLKIAKLEEMRDSLEKGSPCPLCGSTEHPFTDHIPKTKKDDIDEEIASTQLKLKKQQNELDSLNIEVTTCLTKMEHLEKSIEEEATLISKIETEIKKIDKQIGGNEVNDEKVIGKRIEELTLQTNLVENAIQALAELKHNEDLTEQYSSLQINIDSYSELKQIRNAKFGGKNVNDITNKLQDQFEESKSKITELSAVIKKETDSLKRDSELVVSIAKDLEPKIKQLGFSGIDDLMGNILDDSSFSSLTQQNDALSKRQTSVETEIKTLKSNLALKSKLDTNVAASLETVLGEINQQKNQLENHKNNITTYIERLKRDDQDNAKLKTQEARIVKLNKSFEKWSLLHKFIGDANGNKFANFAQGLTLQNLLVYANRRLSNLSDRYLLDKPENDGALIVVDKYQGNISRSVTTLSGGESFLISLALALSLSDMASKNVSLDCLFIDEGFGTLDKDTLEIAITTLEKLQSESQKTVGVISHVDALKERIHTQIKLVKNAQGFSKIKID